VRIVEAEGVGRLSPSSSGDQLSRALGAFQCNRISK
jgi:hypothetical protein